MQGSQAYNLQKEREEGRAASEPKPSGSGQGSGRGLARVRGRDPSFPADKERDIPTPFQALAAEQAWKGAWHKEPPPSSPLGHGHRILYRGRPAGPLSLSL